MVEYGGLRILVGELGVLPDDIRRDLRKGLREAGEAALNQARANASANACGSLWKRRETFS